MQDSESSSFPNGFTDHIRRAASEVSANATFVRIHTDELLALADDLMDMSPITWRHDVHFRGDQRETLIYLLLLNAVNFCFWPSRYIVKRNGVAYGEDDGYFALAAALTNAFDADLDQLTDVTYLAHMPQEDFQRIFSAYEGELTLMDLRLAHFRDVGATLLQRFNGDPRGLLLHSDRYAGAFAQTLVENFASYRDTRRYRGTVVPIAKRAQLCAANVGSAVVSLSGNERLTCFADYKLPQLLRSRGVFRYDTALDWRIRSARLIPEGSRAETEIRCCTITAVSRIVEKMREGGACVTEQSIDYLLWTMSVDPEHVREPYHRTIGTSY